MIPKPQPPHQAANSGAYSAAQPHASAQPYSTVEPLSSIEQVRMVRETMLAEADAIRKATEQVSTAAVEAAQRIASCRGNIVLTGVGKAGWIAQKLVATLASTGSPSHFLHPSEAVHGDLGRVRSDDLVIAFSNSGRSEEVVRVCGYLRNQAAGLIAITATTENPIAEMADLVVPMGRHEEACPSGLAPTSSTTVMLALGDAIAMLASRLRGFAAEDFAKFHPGGALGRKLASVNDIMRPIDQCRVSSDSVSVRQAISGANSKRRSGAVMLVNSEDTLTGIFTDSDLVKLLQCRQEQSLDRPITEAMTHRPVCIASGESLGSAVELLSQRRISELPVIDEHRRPIGMIDVTDLIAAGDIRPEIIAPETIGSGDTGAVSEPCLIRFPSSTAPTKDQS